METITPGEEALNKNGFYLKETKPVRINEKLKYVICEYARFVDDKRKDFDMTITFDPSQHDISIWSSLGGAISISPEMAFAICLRAEELLV